MMHVMKMLRICGWTARAAILGLCVLVAAQSTAVHASPPHDHADCDHAAALQSHEDAAHDHDGAASASHDHGDAIPNAERPEASHEAGCCGWFCSAATLPVSVSCKPIPTITMIVSLPLSDLHDGARVSGLFRPPRMLSPSA